MKERVSHTLELRAQQLVYLEEMARKHALPDVSKALRVLVAYAMATPDRESEIFDTIRCSSPQACEGNSPATGAEAGS